MVIVVGWSRALSLPRPAGDGTSKVTPQIQPREPSAVEIKVCLCVHSVCCAHVQTPAVVRGHSSMDPIPGRTRPHVRPESLDIGQRGEAPERHHPCPNSPPFSQPLTVMHCWGRGGSMVGAKLRLVRRNSVAVGICMGAGTLRPR